MTTASGPLPRTRPARGSADWITTMWKASSSALVLLCALRTQQLAACCARRLSKRTLVRALRQVRLHQALRRQDPLQGNAAIVLTPNLLVVLERFAARVRGLRIVAPQAARVLEPSMNVPGGTAN